MARNGNGNKYSVEMMIDAIQKADGNLSEAARILGCSRTTVHNYVNKYVTVRATYEEENDKFIDLAEAKLRKTVEKGSLPAIMFVLKTKGKHRGYVERQEHTGADGGAIVLVKWDEPTDTN